MPKQILLAMTVHHLTGSAEIISILNRYGHCQSYSGTLELETAMCNSVIAHNNILPPSISTEHNSVVHLCWDNFNLNEETPSGAETTHTAHGIIIQELERGANLPARVLSHVPRSQERTIHPIIEDLQLCFAKAKAEPNFNVTRSRPQLCDVGYANLSDFLWMISRNKSSKTEYSVPSWAGWFLRYLRHHTNWTMNLDVPPQTTWHLFFFQSWKMQQCSMFWKYPKKQQKMSVKSSQLWLLTLMSQEKPLILCGKTKEGLAKS